MKYLGIKKILRKESNLFYRSVYEGEAHFSLGEEGPTVIEFQSDVEVMPTGERKVGIVILNEVDYPLLPLVRELRKDIVIEDQKGTRR